MKSEINFIGLNLLRNDMKTISIKSQITLEIDEEHDELSLIHI